MKNAMILFSFALISTFAVGQHTEDRSSNYPYWTISKDVQRMQFAKVKVQPATITTSSNLVNPKGISRVHVSNPASVSKEVIRTGMPANVISKGVARMQFKRS